MGKVIQLFDAGEKLTPLNLVTCYSCGWQGAVVQLRCTKFRMVDQPGGPTVGHLYEHYCPVCEAMLHKDEMLSDNIT